MDVNNLLLSNGRSTGVASMASLVHKRLACASPYADSGAVGNSNAWYVNVGSGNVNNNNKNNSNAVRAVAALGEEVKAGWVEAYRECCRTKMSSRDCTRYRLIYERGLWQLVADVYNRSYSPAPSTCFVVTRPRLREVFAAAFRDRVVHHWVCMRLEPLFEARHRAQGDVSHNCRKGYGTRSAIASLRSHLERTADAGGDAWVVKYDLRAFFSSIDCRLLWGLLREYVEREYSGDDKDTLLYLTEVIIHHRLEHGCIVQSPRKLWDMLPPGKSLRHRTELRGLPIGNLPSQLTANYLLSHFDAWMLEQCRDAGIGYVRFVDDFCLVGCDKAFLLRLRPLMERRLAGLGLTLHPDKVYMQRGRNGVPYLGQTVRPRRSLLGRRTAGALAGALHNLEQVCVALVHRGVTQGRLLRLRSCVAAANSYLGMARQCSTATLRRKLAESLVPEVARVCRWCGEFEVVRIAKYYKLTNYLLTNERRDYGMELRL